MAAGTIDWQVLYVLATVFSILLMAGFVAFAWRFRRSQTGTWLLISMIGATGWATMVLLMAVLPTDVTGALLNLKFLFIALAPIAMVRVVLDMTGVARRFRGRITLLLLITPLVIQAALWNPAWYPAMISSIQFERTGILTYIAAITFGPLYWLNTGQGYLLMLGSMIVLLVASRPAPPVYRTQLLWVGLAIIAPVISNIVLITKIAPRQYDPMPIGLAVMATCMWWALLRHRLLELVPLARNRLVDAIPDCIVLTDNSGRIVDANEPMCRLLNSPLSQLLGQGLPETPVVLTLAPTQRRLLQDLIASAPAVPDTTSAVEHLLVFAEREFAVRAMALNLKDQGSSLRLLTLSDVTAKRRTERALAESHGRLEEALRQVKTLSGLLPMCAGCKKIRDRIGGWQSVEDYISAHSDAMLTHGVCPDCQTRIYDGFLQGPEPGERPIGNQQ